MRHCLDIEVGGDHRRLTADAGVDDVRAAMGKTHRIAKDISTASNQLPWSVMNSDAALGIDVYSVAQL
jgi:hypothetical protein